MVNIPISVGELVDKITILEIKTKNIDDDDKQIIIATELKYLNDILGPITNDEIEIIKRQLFDVNSELWDVEDGLRDLERSKTFGDVFVELARSVYRLNDLRFRLKNNINTVCDSEIKEVKSYKKY